MRKAGAAEIAHGLLCALRRFQLDGNGKVLARTVEEAIDALKGAA